MFKHNSFKGFLRVTQKRDGTVVRRFGSFTTLMNRAYMRNLPVIREDTCSKRLYNREQNGMDNSEASSRRIRLLIPSGPAALPVGRDFSTVSI